VVAGEQMVGRGRVELPTPGFSVGTGTGLNRPLSAAIGPNTLPDRTLSSLPPPPPGRFEAIALDTSLKVVSKV
jgi:hypothetical protein